MALRAGCARPRTAGLAVDDVDRPPRRCPTSSSTGILAQITQKFGWANKVTPFQNAGVMWDRQVWTRKVEPNFDGKHQTLGEVLVPDDDVPESFFIPEAQIPQWEYLKGAKREARAQRTATSTSTRKVGSRSPTRSTSRRARS